MRIARKPKRRNTIVLTSLVDVMFVLLFFFMLVTTYDDWHSWSMTLSGAAADDADSGALLVQVASDGSLLLDAQPVDYAQVEQRLRQPGARAVLVAGPGVSLQAMVDALNRFKPTGAALTLGRTAAP